VRALITAGPDDIVRIADIAEPEPKPHEAVVAVSALSLNRGEVNRARTGRPGKPTGWDVSGVVVAAAADGSGPAPGTRVVGLAENVGWAERTPIPTHKLAPIPAGLTHEAASTLPIAALTALHCLQAHEASYDTALITGAAGGVGRFAVQLAAMEGARVTAVVGSTARGAGLAELGAAEVVTDMPADGSFDVILESVGGRSLAASLRLVAPGGTVALFGNSSGEATTFQAADFFFHHAAKLFAYLIFPKLEKTRSGTEDLGYLAGLMVDGKLDPSIDVTAPWSEASSVCRALLDRRVAGKAVLTID
jgi:NADPH:quinone reductase-like Zn-dependent oxidoreductase